MMGTGTSIDRELVRARVAESYVAANSDVRHVAAIAPLRLLVAARPLTWREVPGLTTRTSAIVLQQLIGRSVESETGPDAPLSGRLYASASGGYILINAGDPLPRRRYTVAHELGHYVLHVLPALDRGETRFDEVLPVEEQGAGSDPGLGRRHLNELASGALAEEQADLFAAELLMPAATCAALVQRYADLCGGNRQVLARRLATECLVSEPAMKRRLAELQLPEDAT